MNGGACDYAVAPREQGSESSRHWRSLLRGGGALVALAVHILPALRTAALPLTPRSRRRRLERRTERLPAGSTDRLRAARATSELVLGYRAEPLA